MTLEDYKGKLSKVNPDAYLHTLVLFRKKEKRLCGSEDSFYRAYWINQCVELTLRLEMLEEGLSKYWDDLPEELKKWLTGN